MLVANRMTSSAVVSSIRRQLPATRPLVRLTPPVVLSAFAAILVWRAELQGDLAELLFAAAAAVGLSTVLADSAASVVAASPTSLLRRAVARFAIAIPAACVCWATARAAAFIALANGEAADRLTLVVPGIEAWLVLAAAVLLVLGAEASGARAGSVPGVIGSGVVLVSLAITQRLPPPLAVVPVVDHELRWVGLACASVLLLALSLRDPGLVRNREI